MGARTLGKPPAFRSGLQGSNHDRLSEATQLRRDRELIAILF